MTREGRGGNAARLDVNLRSGRLASHWRASKRGSRVPRGRQSRDARNASSLRAAQSAVHSAAHSGSHRACRGGGCHLPSCEVRPRACSSLEIRGLIVALGTGRPVATGSTTARPSKAAGKAARSIESRSCSVALGCCLALCVDKGNGSQGRLEENAALGVITLPSAMRGACGTRKSRTSREGMF